MRFILSHEEFGRKLDLLRKLISINAPLSRNSLFQDFSSFKFMSFASVFNRSFFRSMKAFCGEVRDESFLVLVSDPDPVTYMREFGRFNAISCNANDEPNQYIETLNDGPLGSSADSLVDSSNRLFFFSCRRAWLIVSDRSSNLSYCFFVTPEVAAIFEKRYEGELFSSIEDAAEFSRQTAQVAASLLSFGQRELN